MPQPLPAQAENHVLAHDYTENLDNCMTIIKKGLWLSNGHVISLKNCRLKQSLFVQAYNLGNGNIIAGQNKIIECKDYYDRTQNVHYVAYTCSNYMEGSSVSLYFYKFDMNEPSVSSDFHNPEINICDIVSPRALCCNGINYHIDFCNSDGLYLRWHHTTSAVYTEYERHSYNLYNEGYSQSSLMSLSSKTQIFAVSASNRIHYEWCGYRNMWVVLMEPHQYKPGTKYPAVVVCLGGPYTEIPNFELPNSIYEIFSKAGFWVIVPLRRGVRGISHDWEHLIDGDYGNKDIEDIIIGTNCILSQYIDIDATKVALYGGSYGGYSAMMIAGKYNENNMYKVIISHCGIYDLEHYPYECSGNAKDIMYSYAGTVDIGAYKKAMYAKSPHNYVEKWHCPILIIHTTDDNTVWFGQSVRAYNEALERNKSVCLLLSAGCHTLFVDNMTTIVNIMLQFIKEHLL